MIPDLANATLKAVLIPGGDMTEALLISAVNTDGGTQARAGLSDETIRDYMLDMLSGATFPPVVTFYDGEVYWLADGFHRLEATRRAGQTYIAADLRPGTRRDAILYSVSANGTHGLRRTNEDKRRAVQLLLDDEEWRQWSNHEIARRCGVDEGTVRRYRPELSTEIPQMDAPRMVERNGTTYTMNTSNIGRPTQLIDDDPEEEDWRHIEEQNDIDDESPDDNPDEDGVIASIPIEFYPAVDPIKPQPNAALFTSDSYEWYTPSPIMERVKAVLGEIDLDPASNEIANRVVCAKRYFDKSADGLNQGWFEAGSGGITVYMNPPYGEDIGKWVNKLVDEYDGNNIESAITLLPARTDTAWMRRLSEFPRCFVWGRLKFGTQTGTSDNSATFPSVVIYLGQYVADFAEAFKDIGDIYVQWGHDGSL